MIRQIKQCQHKKNDRQNAGHFFYGKMILYFSCEGP